jgi:hypothetical protein
MADEQISHGDIYHKLGGLEGKLDAVMISMSEKKTDITEAFRRIRLLEARVAQGVILLVCVATVSPLVWTALDPELRLKPGDDAPVLIHPEVRR